MHSTQRRKKRSDSWLQGVTVMAMKIKTEVAGYGPRPAETHALVNVFVEFNGPSESMAMTVLVPNEGDDESALCEKGIARAKDFARQFAALS
jgi:hypothetical protein